MRTGARFLTSLLLTCLIAMMASAAGRTVKKQVLLPNGQNAAGVQVLLRHFASARQPKPSPHPDLKFTTDAQGIIELPIQDENWDADFLLIDVPNCALTLAPLAELESCIGIPDKSATKIRLEENKPFQGRAVDANGKPVAGAEVSWAQRGVNWLSVGASLPQFTTQSAADGSFTLRGVSFDSLWRDKSATFCALLRKGGDVMAAGQQFFPPPISDTTFKAGDLNIVLRPMITVRGQVMDDVKHQPVSQATVALNISDVYVPVRTSIKTGQDGRFEFTGVPLISPYDSTSERTGALTISAKHPDLPMVQSYLYHFADFSEIKPVYAITLRMRPTATLSGRVIDIDTGKPPLWLPKLTGHRSEGYIDGHHQSGTSSDTKLTPETGQFSISLTAGKNYFGLAGPGFYKLEEVIADGQNIYREDMIDVPPQGLNNLLLKARKTPGFWIHLDTDDVQTNFGGLTFVLRLKEKLNGSDELHLRRVWNFLPTKNWGDTIEVRVMRQQEEILPWTKLTADPQLTPIILTIPTKNPEPARIGVQLPIRFSPIKTGEQ